MRCQMLGGILKVALFTPYMIQNGETYPAFEIFLNVDGEEYITRYFDKGEEKWSTALIVNLHCLGGVDVFYDKDKGCNYSWYGYEYHCDKKGWINPEGGKNIRRYLKTKRTGYEGILEWQQAVKDKKRDEADAKVFKPWDDDLKLFPDLPKRFINWAFKENTEHYIFYDAGTTKGYCSRCQKEVDIIKPRHRKEGKCPKCRTKIIYLSNGKKSKYLRTPIAESQIIQPIKDGYVIQVIQTQRAYWNGSKQLPVWDPQLRWNVLFKILVLNGKVTAYEEGWFKQRIYRWIPNAWICHRGEYGRLYKANYKEIAAMFPHSAASLLVKNELDIPFMTYVEREREYPVLESLVKIGLHEIVADSLKSIPSKTFKNTSAAKALELDGSRLKRLIELGGSVTAWDWLRYEKTINTVFDSEMISFYALHKILRVQLDFVRDCAPDMSYKKIYHYLDKQATLLSETPNQLLITWRDYLQMARKNKFRTNLEQIYKPADLKKAHAEQIELANRAEIKKEAGLIRRRYKKVDTNLKEIAKYEFHSDGYAIMVPEEIEDIILEGRILQHCIHRCDFYFERINTKESYILFLRKENSLKTPWYTLEVEPGGNIRQKRTTGDNQNADLNAAMPFLKKWQAHIRKMMSKEDKKLANIADQKRKANYKDIRVNKKLVWHGKHQGQLLADVLEADFMAAI